MEDVKVTKTALAETEPVEAAPSKMLSPELSQYMKWLSGQRVRGCRHNSPSKAKSKRRLKNRDARRERSRQRKAA